MPPADPMRDGLAAASRGDFAAAADCFHEAVRRDPTAVGAWVNLGLARKRLGQLDAAVDALRRAEAVAPRDPDPPATLGDVLRLLGDYAAARAAFARSAALAGPFHPAQGNFLWHLQYDPEVSPAELADAHRAWGQRVTVDAPRPPSHGTGRVGFVSPDVRDHPVARFLAPLLDHLEPANTFIYAEVPQPDAVSQRLAARAAAWRSTVGRSAAAVAAQIRGDRIDVLIDLAGHTGHHRLDVFAHRPAATQLTWLGYPHPTGHPAIDGWITDDTVCPPGDDPGLEPPIRLPGTLAAFAPPADAPPVSPLPVLRTKWVTFAAHHTLSKLNAVTFALWKRVLDAVPGSRLLLFRQNYTPELRDVIARRLAASGVDPNRFTIEQVDGSTYLRRYADVDLILDATPFTGHTMTCESLWMGVPTVTLLGDRPGGRLSAGVAKAVGLPEFVAVTAEEYVEIAVKWANDAAGLAELRAGMRERMRSTIGDGAAFATRFVEAIRRAGGVSHLSSHQTSLPPLSKLNSERQGVDALRQPSIEILTPVRPGGRDRYPVPIQQPDAARTAECADGNLSNLYQRSYTDSRADVVVFKHDDFHVRDWRRFRESLMAAMETHLVVGVAGAGVYSPARPRWWLHPSDEFRGRVAHPTESGGWLPHDYGPAGPVAVLDGALLAVRRSTPRAAELAACFDPEFGRHFYDLAFTWNATRRLGRVCFALAEEVAHDSPGRTDAAWHRAAERFARKYGGVTGPLEDLDDANERGIELARQGRIAEAAAAFREALHRRPDRASAAFNLALALQRAHQFADAERAFERAVRLDPTDAQAHAGLAQLLASQGRTTEAAVSRHHAERFARK